MAQWALGEDNVFHNLDNARSVTVRLEADQAQMVATWPNEAEIILASQARGEARSKAEDQLLKDVLATVTKAMNEKQVIDASAILKSAFGDTLASFASVTQLGTFPRRSR